METAFPFRGLGIAARLYKILIQNQKILHYFRMSPYIMNNYNEQRTYFERGVSILCRRICTEEGI